MAWNAASHSEGLTTHHLFSKGQSASQSPTAVHPPAPPIFSRLPLWPPHPHTLAVQVLRHDGGPAESAASAQLCSGAQQQRGGCLVGSGGGEKRRTAAEEMTYILTRLQQAAY